MPLRKIYQWNQRSEGGGCSPSTNDLLGPPVSLFLQRPIPITGINALLQVIHEEGLDAAVAFVLRSMYELVDVQPQTHFLFTGGDITAHHQIKEVKPRLGNEEHQIMPESFVPTHERCPKVRIQTDDLFLLDTFYHRRIEGITPVSNQLGTRKLEVCVGADLGHGLIDLGELGVIQSLHEPHHGFIDLILCGWRRLTFAA